MVWSMKVCLCLCYLTQDCGLEVKGWAGNKGTEEKTQYEKRHEYNIKRGLTHMETVENVCTEAKRPRTENGTEIA